MPYFRAKSSTIPPCFLAYLAASSKLVTPTFFASEIRNFVASACLALISAVLPKTLSFKELNIVFAPSPTFDNKSNKVEIIGNELRIFCPNASNAPLLDTVLYRSLIYNIVSLSSLIHQVIISIIPLTAPNIILFTFLIPSNTAQSASIPSLPSKIAPTSSLKAAPASCIASIIGVHNSINVSMYISAPSKRAKTPFAIASPVNILLILDIMLFNFSVGLPATAIAA